MISIIHKRLLRWAAPAALLAFAVLFVGCGDDDPAANAVPGPSGEEEVTKASYIAQGDAACTTQNERIRDAIQPYLDRLEQTPDEAVANEMVRRVLAPRMEYEIRTVRAYVLPPENVDQALAFLAAMQDVVERAKKDPLAFAEASRPFAKPERLGREFGFEVCGGL